MAYVTVSMGHDLHGHSHGSTASAHASKHLRVLLAVVVGPLIAATVIGVVLLWPNSVKVGANANMQLVDGTVQSMDLVGCEGVVGDQKSCVDIAVKLHGKRAGETVTYQHSIMSSIQIPKPGTEITLQRVALGGSENNVVYSYFDRQRRSSMLVLGVAFVGVALLIGRRRGLRAVVALAFSLFVLIRFTLPAIVANESPIAVALVTSALIMLVALYLSHGFNARTTSAVIGTLFSLAITGALGVAFIGATSLTGLAGEDALFLRATVPGLDFKGVLLAGMIVGALGVLDDVTVTQASAVWELHQANPTLGLRGLYRSAMRIGQDHIASTVNTLVLAYAGASLPLMLLFTQTGSDLGRILTGEIVATEVVRTVVGSIGLMASVPVTTFLTALLVSGERLPPRPSMDVAVSDEQPEQRNVNAIAPALPGQRPWTRWKKRRLNQKHQPPEQFWDDLWDE